MTYEERVNDFREEGDRARMTDVQTKTEASAPAPGGLGTPLKVTKSMSWRDSEISPKTHSACSRLRGSIW